MGLRQAGTALCSFSSQILGADLIIAVQLTGTDRQPCRQEFFNVKGVLFVIIRQIFIVRVLGNIVLVGEKRPDAAYLQKTLAAVHDGQFINGHQILTQLLIILTVGFLGALRDAGIIHVDGLFPQQRVPAFQRGFFLSSEEQAGVMR